MSLEIVRALSRLGRGSYPMPLSTIRRQNYLSTFFVRFKMPVLPGTQSMHLKTNKLDAGQSSGKNPRRSTSPTDKGAFEAEFRLHLLCDVSKTDPTRF